MCYPWANVSTIYVSRTATPHAAADTTGITAMVLCLTGQMGRTAATGTNSLLAAPYVFIRKSLVAVIIGLPTTWAPGLHRCHWTTNGIAGYSLRFQRPVPLPI